MTRLSNPIKQSVLLTILILYCFQPIYSAITVDDIEASIKRLRSIPPKDQFESTADYEKRLANATDTRRVYRFLYKLTPSTEMMYNANTEVARFNFMGMNPVNPDIAVLTERRNDGYYGLLLSHESRQFLWEKISVQIKPDLARRIWPKMGLIIEGTTTGRTIMNRNTQMNYEIRTMDFEISEVKIVVADTGEVLNDRTRTVVDQRQQSENRIDQFLERGVSILMNRDETLTEFKEAQAIYFQNPVFGLKICFNYGYATSDGGPLKRMHYYPTDRIPYAGDCLLLDRRPISYYEANPSFKVERSDKTDQANAVLEKLRRTK
jgi:hypothetical protein